MTRTVRISDSEWDVMQPIWQAGACTAAEVIRQLAPTRGWNHSTIRTLLARLVEKGALDYDVEGTRYIYRPALSREQCVRQESRSFLEKVFGGDARALLAHFVADAPLDEDEIEQLRQLLARKKEEKRR